MRFIEQRGEHAGRLVSPSRYEFDFFVGRSRMMVRTV
jgi:hypothetical protein